MEFSTIEKMIAEAVAHESKTGTMSRVVRAGYERQGSLMSDAEIDERTAATAAAITAYVTGIPTILRATIAAAERAGVGEQLRPILETAISYVQEDVDFIPDRLGICGLMDDAYLVYGLMQELSHRHRALTGRGLLAESVFADSQRIRRMIGEPTATRLDVAIVAFARRHNVRATIEQIMERIGSAGMGMPLPVAVAFPESSMGIDELPDLELGSLGE